MRIDAEILAQHLDVAAAQYDRDAEQCRRRPQGNRLPAELEALATQFERQAAQARAWAGALRDGRLVRTVAPDVIEVIG